MVGVGELHIAYFDGDKNICEICYENKHKMDPDIDPFLGFIYYGDVFIVIEIDEQTIDKVFKKIKVLTSRGLCGWCYYDYLFANKGFLD